MTRNCLNVMRKLASIGKLSSDYRTQWFNRYGYTADERAKYWDKLPNFSHPSLERYVHNRIMQDRRTASAQNTQNIIKARSKPASTVTPAQQPQEPFWTVSGGWRSDMAPGALQQPTAPEQPKAPAQR